jgi:hypothetical protein
MAAAMATQRNQLIKFDPYDPKSNPTAVRFSSQQSQTEIPIRLHDLARFAVPGQDTI